MRLLSILAIIASSGTAFADNASNDISGTTCGKASYDDIPLGDTHLYLESNTA